MIHFQDLSLCFSGRTIVEGASFTINSNEKLGLVGRNGSGKTSLIKCLMGLVEPWQGQIQKPKGCRIGYLAQHLDFTQGTVLEEACTALTEDCKHDEWRAECMLEELGFTWEHFIEDPAHLSGGWQIKLQLAKCLLSQPDLLLLDEPTNYLDIVTIRWLKKQLQQWPHAFVLITHDRGFMDAVVTHTLIIHRKKVRKALGTSQSLVEQLASEDLVHEQRLINETKQRQQTEAWIAKFKAKASMASRVQSKIKQLNKQETLAPLENPDLIQFDFPYLGFQSKSVMMKVQNCHVGYPDHPLLIEKLSFTLNPGDKLGIIGKNGQGKSTLLRCLGQQLSPVKGNIHLHDKTQLAYFGQMNRQQLDESQTIVEAITEAAPQPNETHIRSICAAMNFDGELADQPIHCLSGGEKSRVAFGRLLMKPANLLLLDEPTNHLDMETCDALTQSLIDYSGGLCLVTHDEGMLSQVVNRLIVFQTKGVTYYPHDYQWFLENIGWD